MEFAAESREVNPIATVMSEPCDHCGGDLIPLSLVNSMPGRLSITVVEASSDCHSDLNCWSLQWRPDPIVIVISTLQWRGPLCQWCQYHGTEMAMLRLCHWACRALHARSYPLNTWSQQRYCASSFMPHDRCCWTRHEKSTKVDKICNETPPNALKQKPTVTTKLTEAPLSGSKSLSPPTVGTNSSASSIVSTNAWWIGLWWSASIRRCEERVHPM